MSIHNYILWPETKSMPSMLVLKVKEVHCKWRSDTYIYTLLVTNSSSTTNKITNGWCRRRKPHLLLPVKWCLGNSLFILLILLMVLGCKTDSSLSILNKTSIKVFISGSEWIYYNSKAESIWTFVVLLSFWGCKKLLRFAFIFNKSSYQEGNEYYSKAVRAST